MVKILHKNLFTHVILKNTNQTREIQAEFLDVLFALELYIYVSGYGLNMVRSQLSLTQRMLYLG